MLGFEEWLYHTYHLDTIQDCKDCKICDWYRGLKETTKAHIFQGNHPERGILRGEKTHARK